MPLLLFGCDDQESAEPGISSGSSEPAQPDLAQASRIAGEAEAGAIVPKNGNDAPPLGSGDLGELGGDANQNQQPRQMVIPSLSKARRWLSTSI